MSDEDIITYKFEHAALTYLENLHEMFHENLKEALTEGKTTSATKSIKLIQRVAASLFVLDNTLKTVINGEDFTFPTEITLEAVKRSAAYVHHLESQKEIIVKVRNVSILFCCIALKVHGQSTLLQLTHLDRFHVIFTDHLYTSVELATRLLTRNTYLTGTVQTNSAGLPADLSPNATNNTTNLKAVAELPRTRRGTFYALQNGTMTFTYGITPRSCIYCPVNCHNGYVDMGSHVIRKFAVALNERSQDHIVVKNSVL